MTISDWLTENTEKLEYAGVATARLDCLVLLEDATDKDRAYILAHPETTVQGSTLYSLNEQIERRAKHEPLAYIRGRTEFYGRKFIINKHVLEPRPESETMVELQKQLINSKQFTIDSKKASPKTLLHHKTLAYKVPPCKFTTPLSVYKVPPCKQKPCGVGNTLPVVVDVGTGSGALAITTKLEVPDIEVILTDIDPNCLKVARQNAKKYEVNVKFYQGNLLEPLFALRPSPFALLCNLPYVPNAHTINQAAMQEPKIAIFGGPDGLDLYRQLFSQLSQNKQFASVKYVLTESLPPQHPALAKIANNHGYKLYNEDDFIQIFVKN